MPTDSLPQVMWTPPPADSNDSPMVAFRTWLAARTGHPMGAYDDLWQFSIDNPDQFWRSLATYFDIPVTTGGLSATDTPGASWFPGSTVNYAEQALRVSTRRSPSDTAIIAVSEDGSTDALTLTELRRRVAAIASALRTQGVDRGDRVVALAPNIAETAIAMLATVSIGAIWSCCPPDYGVNAVVDRFAQIQPTVLFAVTSARYRGTQRDCSATVSALISELDGLRAAIVIGDNESEFDGIDTLLRWDELLAVEDVPEIVFEQVPFEHPLWILYSSGTTGLPKGIVQSHGGIVLEHVKAIALQYDIRQGDRFLWYTTTGWMLWNFQISALLTGSVPVLYDGDPSYPGPERLWKIAADHTIKFLGLSAAYLHSCKGLSKNPTDSLDLSALHTIGSTGSPLNEDAYDWVATAVRGDIKVVSTSGGTDICSSFLTGSPDVPVWRGELSCRALGAAVVALDESGQTVTGAVGELVVTTPMPSMPVALWGDMDGSALRETYFPHGGTSWYQGDWITITDRGSAVVHGRSDATLNRGGVRMGTSEFYNIVEADQEVVDSMVVDTSFGGNDGALVCFLVKSDEVELDVLTSRLDARLRAGLSPRHVPDRYIEVTAIPRTLTGKKCEIPVRKVLTGTAAEDAVKRESLADPDSLDRLLACM